jgi:general secretion pathway protein D
MNALIPAPIESFTRLVRALVCAVAFVFSFSACATDNKAGDATGVDAGPAAYSGVTKKTEQDASVEPGLPGQGDLEEGSDPPQSFESNESGVRKKVGRLPELKPLFAVMPAETSRAEQKKPVEKQLPVELAFDNADLYEMLDATLFEIFGVNYMVDPSIKAKVTFHLSGKYTRNEFINVINNVLQLNDLAIVKGPGEIYKVVHRTSSAGSGNAPMVTDSIPELTGDVTRTLRLKYLAAPIAANNIKPFLSRSAVVVADAASNSLVITDTMDNLNKAVGILKMMDVEYFTDFSWQVFPIMETDATELATDLSKILKTGGLFNRPGIDAGSLEIIPIKTMNALLVVTRWPSILTLVDEWVQAMDHASDSGTNVYVYFVENGNAADLADILIQLYGGKARPRDASKSKKVSMVRPEISARYSGELAGDVEIIPDETNNAIVFKATGRDYKTIRDVIKQLDIVPRQVLINVVIAEITLTGSLEYGVQWFLKGNTKTDYQVQGLLDSGIERAVGTALGEGTQGLSVAVFDSDDFLRGLIRALESESEVNILSSPNVLAVDNKESSIEVGEQVPLPTGQAATDGGNVITSVEYRDTGVLLKVKPQISSRGLVKLELSQEVSEVGNEFDISSTLKANSILNRKAETSLVVEDGQTIVLGGLMKTKTDKGGSGIPFVRNIPLVGLAFGGHSKKVDKTELIFLITPRVVKNRSQADAITQEFTGQVEELKKMIEKDKK